MRNLRIQGKNVRRGIPTNERQNEAHTKSRLVWFCLEWLLMDIIRRLLKLIEHAGQIVLLVGPARTEMFE